MKTLFCLLFGLAVSASAAEWPKGIKAPSGWEVTMFAAPTNVGYPTCLSTAPNGDLYVGVDENGSIDAKPNRGRVVRCTDTDGDGKADKFTTFATMDSPRGIWFENNVLYVQRPPFVTAYFDDNGDGVADRSEDIVKGFGFDLKFRGADHTMNGMRMGIDGFLYIACGDYGATNAVGKDGTTIQLHGGGVVRVRPDGTGLEIVSRGQRNIYDVAVSPEMDLFTRDNTNDGDGWNVRLSQVVMGGSYGYPSLYKKFGDEIIQPMADYGGGSPCGALFMDEPGFPEGFGRGLYTVEWGVGAIMRHPLTNNGASWKAGQSKFVELVRPTDFDVDGSGRLYISSWQGATFTYAGPNAGYVVRVTPPGWKLAAFPDLKKSSQADLLKLLGSPSAFARLYAQREIMRRADKSSYVGPLETLASSTAPIAQRAAAVFTLNQLSVASAQAALLRLAKIDEVREFALRAMADNPAAAPPVAPFVSALTDANPRVRLQAVTALGRLGKAEAASKILPLVADSDPTVVHLAVQSLAKLGAVKVCLAAFDSPGTTNLLHGAGRALELQHEAVVVDGLIERLAKTSDAFTRRIILKALCRLHNREAEWKGKWWGTRPDSRGPYFSPVEWAETKKIAAALRDALAKADPETLLSLMGLMQANRVELPEATAAVLRLAATDAKFRAQAIEMFSSRPVLPDEAVSFFGQIASSSGESPATRVKAIRALQRSGKPAAFDAAVAALTSSEKPTGELVAAWEEFARDPKQSQNLARFVKLAESGSPGERTLGYAVLGSLASVKVSSKATKASASRALEQAWAKPETAAPLLQAIARLKLDQFALQVRAMTTDPSPAVAAAAKQTAQALGLDAKPAVEPSGALIEKLPYDEVVAAAVKDKGDARIGAKFFLSLGCVACHAVSSDEAPKGPFLGGIATRYNRAELSESILKPNAKIAQGFETQSFKTKDGEELEGFVTREGGEDLDVRNIAGITTTLAKKDIKDRGKRETSAMPQGMADKLTPADLASILAYLESLKSK